MNPQTTKKLLHAAGAFLFALGLGLQQAGVLPPAWAAVGTLLASVGGMLSGKAMPTPGSTPAP